MLPSFVAAAASVLSLYWKSTGRGRKFLFGLVGLFHLQRLGFERDQVAAGGGDVQGAVGTERRACRAGDFARPARHLP